MNETVQWQPHFINQKYEAASYLKRGPATAPAGCSLRLRHDVVCAPASALMLIFVARHAVNWNIAKIIEH